MKQIELMGVLKVIKDDGTITIISEGDYVTCCVKENQYYVGTLSRIGYWKTDETEILPIAIAIESNSPKTVCTSNVILLSDIKWICKINKDEKTEIEKLFSKVQQPSQNNHEMG